MALLDQYEIKRRRYNNSRAGNGARREFEFPRDLVVNNPYAIYPRGDYFPGETGPTAPVVMDWDLDMYPTGKYATLAVIYRAPTCEEWLELHAPKGVLVSRFGMTAQRRRTNLAGQVIEGPDPTDDSGRAQWKVISGSNLTWQPNGTLRIHAVVHSPAAYRDALIQYLGCYNNVIVPVMANAGVGQLLFSAIEFRPSPSRAPDGRKLYTADYDFMANPIPWNTPCVSAEFSLVETTVPLMDGDVEVDPAGGTAITLAPTGDTRSSVLLRPWNFFQLAMLLNQSW